MGPPVQTDLRARLKVCLLFAAFFCAVYGGTNLLTDLHQFRLPLHFDFELKAAFIPAFSILYVSLYLLMGMLPLVFRSWQELVPIAVTLMFGTLSAAICFILLPVEYAFTHEPPTGVTGAIFRFADLVNLDHNMFPSLHVMYAWTSAIAIGMRYGLFARTLLLLWALGISVSTVLTHQHYLADVAGGFVLSVAGIPLVYRRAQKPRFLENCTVELTCLRMCLRFMQRHVRYLIIFLIIYRHSLFRWRSTRVLRVSFCLMQHIDDLLDGDWPTDREPLEIVDRLILQFEEDHFDETDIGKLAHCVAEELKALRTQRDDPLSELLTLLRVMRFDRQRVRDQLLLSRDELDEQHWQTFYYSVNIMLIISRAELRAAAAVDLVRAFGWCSTMRDLREDVDRGLINIPLEVMHEARAQGASASAYELLTATPVVREWIQSEHVRGKQHLDLFATRLEQMRHRNGASILRTFLKSMYRFHERFPKRNPDLFHPAIRISP